MGPLRRNYALIRIPFWLFLTALPLSGLLSGGCAINPATGRPALTGLMTTSEEIRIGREQHPKILQAFGGAYHDPAINSYVDRVGQTLARHTERTDVAYTFTVLNSPIANALATPGGYIYVTRGMLALVNNEAELAGILGHELGHITALHHAQAQSRQTLASIGLTVLAATVGVPPSLMQGTQLAALAFLRAFSREQEYEADQLGARYMARSGYDPDAMVSFLRNLEAHSDLQARILGGPSPMRRFDFLDTHPNTPDRIASAISAANVTVAARPIVGRDSYLDAIDGMLYGESAEQGYIRGRLFAHPALRIRFAVPRGYQLFDARRAIYALGPGNAIIIFDSEPRAKIFAQRTMVQYVEAATKADLNALQAMRVDGLEAATGWINVRTNRGPMELRLAAIRADASHIYRFRFLTALSLLSQLGPGNLRTIQSFRKLTPAEAAALKPLRVRVATVKRGDAIATIAKRMAFERDRIERFRVLNGLGADSTLIAGQRVKIVTE